MRTLVQAIEDELVKESIHVVELYEVDFGNGMVFFWSDQDVDNTISFDGKKYEGRVKSTSSLPFTVGASDDQASFTGWNGDLFFTNLVNNGVTFDNARWKVHRLFPGLAPPNNAIKDYWHGRVVEYSLSADACDFSVAFGFLELSRRALRRYESTCNNLFADGLHCPYDPLTGFGLPERKAGGTATGGSATTLVDTGKDFTILNLNIGEYVFNKTKTATGIITAIAATTLTVDSWRNGAAPASGDSYIVGPKFVSCAFDKGSCIARGMFGPNAGQVDGDLNKVKRRFYVGLLQPASVPFSGKQKTDGGRHQKSERFNRLSQGNDSLAGAVVPVVFGSFIKRDLDVLGVASAGDFLHVLLSGGEGRVYDIQNVLVNDVMTDNVDFRGTAAAQESLVKWGTDADSGANDSSDVDLTTEQKKQAVGSRQAKAFFRSSNLDTYKDNPFLFNAASGDGVSPAGLLMLRHRTEPKGGAKEDVEFPKSSASITGLMTLMPPSSSAQEDDFGVTDYTKYPNPIQVAYYFLRNRRWGAGLDDAQIDLASVRAESDYCQETIASSQSQFSTLSTTVGFGSPDALTGVSRKTWIWVETDITQIYSWVGGTLKVTQTGKEFRSLIVAVLPVPSLPEEVFPGSGETIGTPSAKFGNDGAFIIIADEFPAGKEPIAGDTIEIIPHFENRRFKANGELNNDTDVDEMLQSILDNCAGSFIQDLGKISFIIRKQVDLANVISTTKVFTDKGTKRNVIQDSGKSSMTFNPDPAGAVPNSIAVEFADQASDYRKVTLVLRDQTAQERIGKLFGEKRRDKRENSLSLNLTTTRDQAARLGSLVLRERGTLPGGRSNGVVAWISPIHDAVKLQPIKDVVSISSDHIPSYIQFVRIMEIEDNPDKMTITVKARPYFDQTYDDTAEEWGIEFFPTITPDSGVPLPFKIETLTEKSVIDAAGETQTVLEAKFTLP